MHILQVANVAICKHRYADCLSYSLQSSTHARGFAMAIKCSQPSQAGTGVDCVLGGGGGGGGGGNDACHGDTIRGWQVFRRREMMR